MSSTLDAYELIRFAEAFEARLATAGEMLSGWPGLESEKQWLATALEWVRTARAPAAGLLERVKDLPELEEAREEYGYQQLGLWVDALEKLHAGITFAASSRAPVIEALFPHLKFPQLRRAPREAIIEFATSYERRTKSSYVTRIFARDDFALVRPVMEQVAAAYAAWRSSHEPTPLAPEQESSMREELLALGQKLEVPLRQARLLSDAALVPVPTVYEAAGLTLKPRRRTVVRGLGPSPEEDLTGILDEPADPLEPTEAELAEVAALDAGGAGEAQDSAPSAAETAVTASTEEAVADEAPRDEEQAEAPPVETEAAGEAVDVVSAESDSAPGPTEPSAPPERSAPAPKAGAKAARTRSASPASAEVPTPSEVSGAAVPDTGESPTTGAAAPEESDASADASAAATSEPRSARKGRKKAEPVSPPPPEAEEPSSAAAPEAPAPRVRKKKAAPAPGASGSETP